ncbi:hypothetical protein PHMEG_00034610, partial [Phytophthora megakarya]
MCEVWFDYEPRSEDKASDNGERIKLYRTSYAVERRRTSRLRLDSWYGRPGDDWSIHEDDYVDDELEDKAPVQEPDLHENADVFVTKSGGMKSLSRNLADEFEEAGKPEPAHDDIDELNDDLKKSSTMTRGASKLTTKKDGNRPPINGDTPVANKTLGQCLNAILEAEGLQAKFKSLRLVHAKRDFNAAADYISKRVIQEQSSLEVTDLGERKLLQGLNRIHEKLMKDPSPREQSLVECAFIATARGIPRVGKPGTEGAEEGLAVGPKKPDSQDSEEDVEDTCRERFLRDETEQLSLRQTTHLTKIAGQFVLDFRDALFY